MSAQNSKKQKARFFVLAFALSFFVLAMMGLIVVFVLNPVEEENPSSQISTDTFYLPQRGGQPHHSAYRARSAGKAPLFFALVRLDMLEGRVPVILFPPQTALNEQTGYATLSEAYQKAARPPQQKALSDSFSIPVDRYADGGQSGAD